MSMRSRAPGALCQALLLCGVVSCGDIVATSTTTADETWWTRLLLDPRVVNHSATDALLRPGIPTKDKRNPLLSDRSRGSETGAMIFGDVDVLYDARADLFKMWHNTPSCPGVDGAYVDVVYRSSPDGIEWSLPNLSIVPRRNVTATGGDAVGPVGDVPNVVIPCSGAMGIWHEPDDVDCPFKAFGQFNFGFAGPYTACGTACSEDGVHWPLVIDGSRVYADARSGDYPLSDRHRQGIPACKYPDTGNQTGCYRARCDTHQSAVRLKSGSWLGTTRTRMRSDLGRTEAILVSNNFEDWGVAKELVALGQSVRNSSGIHGHGGPWPAGGDDIDSMIVFHPPLRSGHQLVSSSDFLLGFVMVHRMDCPHISLLRNKTTCYESQLVMSTDPTNPASWRAVFPPEPSSLGFIPLGQPGSFDSNYVAATLRPFVHPNRSRIQLYYLGNNMGDELAQSPRDADGIGLAEIGPDGWAGYLTPSSKHSSAVITSWHKPEADSLSLVLGCDGTVANFGACGTATVTVLDGHTARPLGTPSLPVSPVAGSFSAPIHVTWLNASGLREGQTVALRIELTRHAVVYSFSYGRSLVL